MTVVVIGAGVAGLACALALADHEQDVELHEAAPQAGGRCRSWRDARQGVILDNGSHVLVGGNRHALAYLRRIGSRGGLAPAPVTLIRADAADGRRRSLPPYRLLPDLARSLGQLRHPGRASVADRLVGLEHYRDVWSPLCLAALNTPPAQASARLFGAVLARSLWQGPWAGRLLLPQRGLSEIFVQPALETLSDLGVQIRLGHPLRQVIFRQNRVDALRFDDYDRHLSRHDRVVLALPWHRAATFLPHLPALPGRAIINGHFLCRDGAGADHGPIGVENGLAQWLFRRCNVVSATISAADSLLDWPAELLARLLWRDIARITGQSRPPAAWRIFKERQATLRHDAATNALRPASRQGRNLYLAGDWTATGLPCTLESAILSGKTAAKQLIEDLF
ncbi:hypothetical protein GALL_311520 [mine drainage metagenome]|uniref:Amine oxidase domain-containing protein n=1 Tax=mine drainage metagenome TaxID=410659 RepID=A0A1J5QUK9_9ZZZZ